eukprot:7133395-Prymnesium_polylepis.2
MHEPTSRAASSRVRRDRGTVAVIRLRSVPLTQCPVPNRTATNARLAACLWSPRSPPARTRGMDLAGSASDRSLHRSGKRAEGLPRLRSKAGSRQKRLAVFRQPHTGVADAVGAARRRCEQREALRLSDQARRQRARRLSCMLESCHSDRRLHRGGKQAKGLPRRRAKAGSRQIRLPISRQTHAGVAGAVGRRLAQLEASRALCDFKVWRTRRKRARSLVRDKAAVRRRLRRRCRRWMLGRRSRLLSLEFMKATCHRDRRLHRRGEHSQVLPPADGLRSVQPCLERKRNMGATTARMSHSAIAGLVDGRSQQRETLGLRHSKAGWGLLRPHA